MYLREFNPNQLWLSLVDFRRFEVEKFLNSFGSIPIISTASGTARIVVFGAQTFVDTTKAIVLLVRIIFENKKEDKEEKELFLDFAVLVLHDASNVIKGAIEIIPIVGNLVVLTYNLFGPRFGYAKEDTTHYMNFDCCGDIDDDL